MTIVSKDEQIKAIEEVRVFLMQDFLMWDFQEIKKKDLSYKLLFAIETIKKSA